MNNPETDDVLDAIKEGKETKPKFVVRLNMQPAEKQVPVSVNPSVTNLLEIVKVWETIQGEGPFVGYPAVFVRLAGCNLVCPYCDTDYTTNRRFVTAEALVDEIEQIAPGGLVVMTGGEPFRQHVGEFARRLFAAGNYQLQFETNGTLFVEDFPWYGPVTIVCSPKTPKLNEDMIPHILYYKYIVRSGEIDPVDGLPVLTLGRKEGVARPPKGFDRIRVFVQPMDEPEESMAADFRQGMNVNTAVTVCRQFGYRLSLQTHKILGLE